MGFFSWRNQDTGKAIMNMYSSSDDVKATLTDDKGNKWVEDNYEGYGVFGGKDYYELLAEMNGKTTRSEGISLEFDDDVSGVKFPNLNYDSSIKYQAGTRPLNANGQGHWEEEYDEE